MTRLSTCPPTRTSSYPTQRRYRQPAEQESFAIFIEPHLHAHEHDIAEFAEGLETLAEAEGRFVPDDQHVERCATSDDVEQLAVPSAASGRQRSPHVVARVTSTTRRLNQLTHM